MFFHLKSTSEIRSKIKPPAAVYQSEKQMKQEKEMNFTTLPWEQAARVFWTNKLGEFLHETLPGNALSLLFQYVLDGFQFSCLLWFQDSKKHKQPCSWAVYSLCQNQSFKFQLWVSLGLKAKAAL